MRDAGALAGAVTGVLTTPLDVIKTRLMTQGNKGTYSSVWDCAHKIWTKEGPNAFLRVRVASNRLSTERTSSLASVTHQHAWIPVTKQSRMLKSSAWPCCTQGWQPRVIWIGLGGCVFFTALEESKKLYLPKQSTTFVHDDSLK